MKYVALLRGINVGGNAKVEMPRLKQLFIDLGFTEVITYINSGNVIFSSQESPSKKIIEDAILKEFGLNIKIVIRDQANLKSLERHIPLGWQNNAEEKTDIFFLWEEVDNEKVLELIDIEKGFDEVFYHSGALVWNVKRENINKSGMLKIVGTPFYKQVTVRNVNTLRKIVTLLKN